MNTKRLLLAKKTLQGISIGDAFGESFFGETQLMLQHIRERTIPQTTWEFTDDTIMSIAVYEQLERFGAIRQDDLAIQFAKKHDLDPMRGYGATARRILRNISEGQDWKTISQSVFDGMGSMGNGASMRVHPIGAYFYDDIEKVKHQARLSAEITHSHEEGICGAIAVAVATALSTQNSFQSANISPNDFIEKIGEALPSSDIKSKILKSRNIPVTYHIETIRHILGDGTKILAIDTVPFAIWCAAHFQNDFENALWKAISILGDRDTICATVGGITIMNSTMNKIPKAWLNAVEKVETSIFKQKS